MIDAMLQDHDDQIAYHISKWVQFVKTHVPSMPDTVYRFAPEIGLLAHDEIPDWWVVPPIIDLHADGNRENWLTTNDRNGIDWWFVAKRDHLIYIIRYGNPVNNDLGGSKYDRYDRLAQTLITIVDEAHKRFYDTRGQDD